MAINTTRPSRPNICIFFILLRLICRLVYEVYEKEKSIGSVGRLAWRRDGKRRKEERRDERRMRKKMRGEMCQGGIRALHYRTDVHG
jgi:hypothetical protein